jgi:arginine-tRNA-protein transferase
MSQSSRKISFYASPEHPCNYITDRQATTVFVDPEIKKDRALHTLLSLNGFRRSGEHIYRPECQQCNACTPVRIPVKFFKPNRAQRRNLKLNQNIVVTQHQAEFREEHFEMYQRYITERHTGGGMDNPTPESYMEFLTSNWSETLFYEFRLDEALVSVAVVDRLDNALSAVYTFFDSSYSKLSPGRFAILYEIQQAQALNLDWLYLGYWIKNCKKMSYKEEYRPQLHFSKGHWHDPFV